MTICINRCVMILRAMPGIRNGICNGCLQYKGKVSGATFRERKLLLAARDLRDIPTSGFMIFCLKYHGFDSQQTFTRIFTRILSISRRARIAKRTTAARTERRTHTSPPLSAGFFALLRLNHQREPAAPYPAQYQILNDSSAKNHRQKIRV